jgi:hypothetical protein
MMKKFKNKTNSNRRARGEAPRRSISLATDYRFRRSVAFQLGVNTYTGFSNETGSLVYGQGLGFNFTLLSVNMFGTSGSSNNFAMPSAAEFVSLFDMFKIEKIKVRMVPSINVTQTSSSAIGTIPSTGLPIVQTAVDYDDSVPPSAQGDLLQRTDVKFLRLDREIELDVTPRWSAGANEAGNVVNGAAPSRGFLETTTNGQNVEHYGRKFWIERLTGSPGVQQGIIQFYVDYELTLRGPR